MLFHACPLLHQWSHDHEQAFNTFMQYKTRVPVCGAIMLNETWEKVCRTRTHPDILTSRPVLVHSCEGMEIFIGMGLSQGQDK